MADFETGVTKGHKRSIMWQICYGGEWWAMATTICMEPRCYWQQPWTKYLLKAKKLEIKCICVKNRKTNTSASYILSSDLLITFSSLSFSVHPTPNFGVRDHSPLAASFGEQSSSFFHFLYFSALFFLFDYVLFFFLLMFFLSIFALFLYHLSSLLCLLSLCFLFCSILFFLFALYFYLLLSLLLFPSFLILIFFICSFRYRHLILCFHYFLSSFFPFGHPSPSCSVYSFCFFSSTLLQFKHVPLSVNAAMCLLHLFFVD